MRPDKTCKAEVGKMLFMMSLGPRLVPETTTPAEKRAIDLELDLKAPSVKYSKLLLSPKK
jgi:hypothetical protein